MNKRFQYHVPHATKIVAEETNYQKIKKKEKKIQQKVHRNLRK